MKKFEVGKSYYCMDFSMDTVSVVKRTEKMITVVNDYNGSSWRMKVRNDGESEYAVDSCVPNNWKQVFTYYADREVK